MKFIVSSQYLLSHLQAISRVINSKNTLAILDNFLFSVTGNSLTVTASDLETTLITSLEVESSEKDGSFAVPAKFTLDILKGYADLPLTFSVDETYKLVISSATGVYNIIAQNGDEYPSNPVLSADSVQTFTAPVKELEVSISKTIFATADDELRPVMNGINIDISTESVTFAASDAHKLVRIKNLETHGEADASFILPKKPAALLKNILPKEDGNVKLEFDNKNVCFTLQHYKMFCRQIEGRYPNYNSVIPQNNPFKMIVDRSMMISMLNRVAVCSNQASNLVKLSIAEGTLQMTAQDIDFSISAKEEMPCQFDGDSLNIGFKSSFLVELLQNLDSEEVVFEFADNSRAGVIKPIEQNEDQDVLMLLMPMMLND